jgi:hypothetical protein
MMSANSPPLYFLATLKVKPGKMAEFLEVMPRVVAIMETQQWRLVGAWGHLIGRLNVVVDLWSVPDANAIPRGFAALMQRLEYPELSQALGDCVEDENLQLMTRMPYDPGRA